MSRISPALYRAVNPGEIRYDLKKPCADCPFRRDVPAHEGIAVSIPEYADHIKEGIFSHTCHKTDARSDGLVDGYEGPIQHCAGSLIFMLKMKAPIQVAMLDPLADGRLDLSRYDKADPRVFRSVSDLVKHFLPAMKKRLAIRKQQDEWRAKGWCEDCGWEFAIPETRKCGFGCDNMSGNRLE